MKNKKAILVWSDGIETNYTEYTSTPDKTAVEQAQDQMHKEYQEHGEANEECGAFEGDMECYFAAEDQDSCRWTVIPVSEDEAVKKTKAVLSLQTSNGIQTVIKKFSIRCQRKLCCLKNLIWRIIWTRTGYSMMCQIG